MLNTNAIKTVVSDTMNAINEALENDNFDATMAVLDAVRADLYDICDEHDEYESRTEDEDELLNLLTDILDHMNDVLDAVFDNEMSESEAYAEIDAILDDLSIIH